MLKAYNKWKKFFIINLAVGVFSYFMMISLQLLNQLDAIWHYGYGGAGNWERGIGRWFWPYLDELRFGLFTDPFCNVLALSIFIIGNIIVFETIGFGPDLYRTYAISFMFLISTSVCTWLSFRYMSNTFATAYVLAVLTAYLCKKGVSIKCSDKISIKRQVMINDAITVALASISLMLSLASYQAFFDSTCLIMLTAFMLMLYKNEDASELIHFFVKSIISIACGAVLYFIGMKISFRLHGIEQLNSYNEGDSLGLGNTILNIPTTLGKTYKYFSKYFFDVLFRWNRLQEHGAFRFLIFGLIIATFIVGIIVIARKNVVYGILFTICGLLLPVSTNVVLFMATESYLSIQMTNGLAMFLTVAFILVFEILLTEVKELKAGKVIYVKKAVSVAAVLATVLVIYGNYISVQIDQEACREGTTGTVTLAREILDSLKNLGYADKGGTVCFVGTPCGNERFMYSEIYPMANELMQFGNWGNAASTHTQTWVGIYREHLGYYVAPCAEEDYERIVARDDVAAMPMFPRAGSIREIDGVTVVKISNNY